jgi:hypothetical protein
VVTDSAAVTYDKIDCQYYRGPGRAVSFIGVRKVSFTGDN